MNSIKTLLSTIVLLLVFQQAHSKQFFIQARAGAGLSGIANNNIPSTYYKSGLGSNANVTAGWSKFGFNFGIGIASLNTSYKMTGLTFEDNFDPATGLPTTEPVITDVTVYFRQIIIPITVSYTLLPNRKISITPEIGIGPCVRTRNFSKLDMSDGTTETTKGVVTSDPITAVGQMAINVVYNINNRIGISFTPQYTRNLFNITSSPFRPNAIYSLTGNVGVLVKL